MGNKKSLTNFSFAHLIDLLFLKMQGFMSWQTDKKILGKLTDGIKINFG